jgi:2-polyprenyl-3-methyl-5-hydroxy-6-metoxy-1,4-benzoquinol methylase
LGFVEETRAVYWEDVYGRTSPPAVSWYQTEPTVSLDLLDAVGVRSGSHVVDVCGGASTLVDRLLDLNVEVTVLDVAKAALDNAEARLQDGAAQVTWLVHDLLTWNPARQYDVWHDRAVYHFLTGPSDRDRYRRVLGQAVRNGGYVIVGTFAEDGPEACSGLPATRYSFDALAREFPDFDVVAKRREEHHTPRNSIQPFNWLLLHKRR